jgi:hypothetical protein
MQDKNSTFTKKLKSYSALAGSMIAAGATADAQVVYTDVSPDLTINAGGFYNLDLNNDGTIDFKIEQRSGTIYSYFQYDAIGVLPEASMNAVDTLGMECANAAGPGFSVDATRNWVDSTAMATQFPPTASALAATIPAMGYTIGNFMGQSGKFLPLRFNMGGDTYYGWVRLDVAADALSFTVVDYAYRNSPDAPSITGLTTDVGVAESSINGVNIFAYEKNISVKLDSSMPVEGVITVRNTLGQVVLSEKIVNAETLLNLDQQKTGAYMVSVDQAAGGYTKKIILQ